MSSPPHQVIRRRPASPPVYLLDVVVEESGRTRAHGALWDGLPPSGGPARRPTTALTSIPLEADLATGAPRARVADVVERALQSGTITRTIARAVALDIVLLINGDPVPIDVPDWDRPIGDRPSSGSA